MGLSINNKAEIHPTAHCKSPQHLHWPPAHPTEIPLLGHSTGAIHHTELENWSAPQNEQTEFKPCLSKVKDGTSKAQRASQIFPAIEFFARRSKKTPANRKKSVMQLWVTEKFGYHLKQFLTLESSEHPPNLGPALHWKQQQTIPCLKSLLKSWDRCILTLKSAPLFCLCNRSEPRRALQGAFVHFHGCCRRSRFSTAPWAFPARPLFAVLSTRVHMGIIKDLVQTNQGRDCSVLPVFQRCYAISSSLQWTPLSELHCFPFPAQNSSSLKISRWF